MIAQIEGAPAPGAAATETSTTEQDPGTITPDQVPKKKPAAGPDFLLLIGGMFVVMYFFMIRPQKKRQKQQQEMQTSLQKNTRIRTIGGIIGTVVDVRDDEVVIKIDEASNTKMRITRGAVGKVLTEDEQKPAK
ncbi:MAG: preprotein translocase subunit YajC [Sedimentisphaerales bacterium]|nr:preprotein translocase subunit YajC [Sedimentisphaerales bacterium]